MQVSGNQSSVNGKRCFAFTDNRSPITDYLNQPVTHIKYHLLKTSSHDKIFYMFDTFFDVNNKLNLNSNLKFKYYGQEIKSDE